MTVIRGTTQIVQKAPLTAQKSLAPLTLRLRAVLTKARAACSGAIGYPTLHYRLAPYAVL